MAKPVDTELAAKAVAEARKSKWESGRTPLHVGAVAVRDGEIIDVAHRGEQDPRHHAEFTLLELKLRDQVLAGSTVFTTLEPCIKRGPGKVACAHRLIERRVSRVVIGTLDPNPDIQGRGYMELRQAGIIVDFFPHDLVIQLEELNRQFFREKRAGQAPVLPTPQFIADARRRRLDQWYRSLNTTFFHRNFDRRPSDVCLHLIEVVGGLSLLASDKIKPGLEKEWQVPKALAWWMALCGKVGVRSVEEMLWDKFPHRCPYCLEERHNQDKCAERKAASPGPAWAEIAQFGVKDRERMPMSLGGWQRMFFEVYPVNQGEQYGPVFGRLGEELAELSEAVRVFSSMPGYFLSEAADVFAWLMRVQNLIDEKAGNRGPSARGRMLEENFARAYPDACNSCGRRVCACPPILYSTVGRITHEVPADRSSYGPNGRFMTPDRAAEFFGPYGLGTESPGGG